MKHRRAHSDAHSVAQCITHACVLYYVLCNVLYPSGLAVALLHVLTMMCGVCSSAVPSVRSCSLAGAALSHLGMC